MSQATVSDVQQAIATLRVWGNDDFGTCPAWAQSLIISIADTIEQILSKREHVLEDKE